MDKYKRFKREAQNLRAKSKMCLDKVPFETEDLAYQKGQRSYKCRHCGKWHRSGKLAKLIAQVRKLNNTAR